MLRKKYVTGAFLILNNKSENKTGLYLHPFGYRPHFTYHEDGKTWYRTPLLAGHPDFNIKKQREPLDQFEGPESLISHNILDFKSRSPQKYMVKPEDVIINLEPPFCFEIILSGKEITLPSMEDRPNSIIFIKKDFSPLIIIEAFNQIDRRLVEQRFRRKHINI